MGRAVIPVVDDERPIVELISDLAIEHGHIPVAASNGLQALEQARTHHPTLIISDVMMPVMDGYALLAALRTDPALADTAVYLMSAASFRDPPAVQPGPSGYIPKPFDFAVIEGLLAAIADAEQPA